MPSPEPHPSVFTTMQQPTPLLKYGQQGAPHFRYFFLSSCRSKLIWHSDKKKNVPTQIKISAMTRLKMGQESAVFQKNMKRNHPEHLSFSLYYRLDPNSPEEKTLDVVCKDINEIETWVSGLQWLIENKETVSASASELDSDITSTQASMKMVDVSNLRKQMNAHLDLCTWGDSSWGQLGHADRPENLKDIDHPKKIRELIDKDVDVKVVRCGESHTVAVSKTGECYAWGNANSGRLGIAPKNFNGIFDHVLLPQCVESLRGVVSVDTVACGAAHTLFVTRDARLFATGCNASGQLGTGTREDSILPVEVQIPSSGENKASRVVSVAAGDQSSACVVNNGGSSPGLLYTWGGNIYGNLGHGDHDNRLSPTLVSSLASSYSVRIVACGGFHMAIIADSTHTKSFLNRSMSTGDDEEVYAEMLDDSYRGQEVTQSGHEQPVVLTWGWGECGQLGHENFLSCSQPKVVDFLCRKTPLAVSCGAAHTACILDAGNEESRLYVWGAGVAVSSDSNSPNVATPFAVDVPSSSSSGGEAEGTGADQSVIDVACGGTNVLYLTETGFMHILGQIPSDVILTRMEDYSDKDAKSIAAGGRHFAVLVGRKWIDDGDTDKCMECGSLFMFVFRGRHHCRSCGGIYCDNCSRKRAPVLKYGFQELVRVCDNCYIRINNGHKL
mmetsp:Transcript_3200/g.4964  ORF Transcript_3200/g.4964 Transcript_3200/m.4964 type:complete len:670 (-) Transcript_3200:109-2118(-)|eukprot:CAMPEP_0185030282 /NCGR_PEP_ID=MMETSP1103-20130426/17146_1 /TAXON_ID=36769 /ORGANISM="Paraphysomonas bandaiensis, Strain Caron Lab Isolate" /LENGTH=669 /DNA_ID=CAMNT_0027565347 /DNA_START=36 /DNA_END=2045 /DNA_ORIENTATION=-